MNRQQSVQDKHSPPTNVDLNLSSESIAFQGFLMEQTPTNCDTAFINFHLLTMDTMRGPWGLLRDGIVLTQNGRILWVGPSKEMPPLDENVTKIDGGGRFLSPGLIDCHTHLVYAGSRADEFELRLQGSGYEEIAQHGGGILSTVNATRAATEEQLFDLTRARAESLMRQGVTTIEIKSGYGLNVETEMKQLQVASQIANELPISIEPTLLGAHTVPPEYQGRSDAYIALVCNDMIPATRDLCSAVDVFCERIAFDRTQTERVFEAALDSGLQIKVHAEQLSNNHAAYFAAQMGALSADHLEYLDEDGVRAMAKHGTVATLLPGAFYFLRERQRPPVKLLREYGVPIALASDANPGSSPVASLLLMLNMGCTLFGLTPEEAFVGVTRNAARALAIADRVGTLTIGRDADLAVWNIQSPTELAYGIGHNPCHAVYKRGRLVHESPF